jgi:hypothetical protein
MHVPELPLAFHPLHDLLVTGRTQRAGAQPLRLSALEERRSVNPDGQYVDHGTQRTDFIDLAAAHAGAFFQNQPSHLTLDDLVDQADAWA